MSDLDQIREEFAGMSDEDIRLGIMRGASSERQAMAKQIIEERREAREVARFRQMRVITLVAAAAAVVAAVAAIGGLFL